MSNLVEEIRGIEPPRTREQLTLLLMRWNALNSQNVKPNEHMEMFYLMKLLQSLAAQQHAFAERKALLLARRKTQRGQLQAQLVSYKFLTRNLDLPEEIQAELVAAAGEHPFPNTVRPEPEEKTEDLAELTFDERQKRLKLNLSAANVAQANGTGRAVGGGAEIVLRNRLGYRLNELERLNANLGTIDSKEVDCIPPDGISDTCDTLKLRAVVELKQLRLLVRQKSMRQHIVYHLAAESDPIARSFLHRFFNRRAKMPTLQDLQLTEHLERQQRVEREKLERASRMRVVSAACTHTQELQAHYNRRATKRQQLVRTILQTHAVIAREEAKKLEKTAKQRLAALRANDEEAYIKLLDQTKDTRLTHLLKQTNQFLASLSQAVRVQQAETGLFAEEGDSGSDNRDYYEIAHHVKEVVNTQPKMLVGGKLKEYQIKGLQWMVSLVNNNLNGILADEMGLGKTIQSISLISYLIEVKRWTGPFLVIVPLSTITNWNVEFDKWVPSIRKVVYKGPPASRKAQQGRIRAGDFQVLLTTYEYVIRDRPLLSKIKWQHMIIDEGHRMKNTQSKLSYTLTQYYHSRFRLILTGTPLQNNLPELWALLNFVLPKIFNSVKTFDEWFNTPFANTGGQDRMELTEEETLLIIRRLHKVLRPFLLRRLKKDVEKDLPDKVEKVVKCSMSALQLKLYEHMVKHNVLYTGAPADPSSTKLGIRGLNNKIMQLRKICNHPYVFEEVEDLINPSRESDDQLWRTSGKFELLDRILPKLRVTGHRVLIFFQMTQVMNIMEDYLRLRGINYLRLDGATKAEERSEMLRLFNAKDSPYFCFLLSTRAGGLGLNLQTADTVIIYDTDWNPFQDLQAQDRAHRIGQTKEVRILRLITADSIEEAILDRALAKLEIDGKVIQAGKFDNKSTAEEQEAFLRSLMEAEEQRRENKNDEDETDEDLLNDILARSEEERQLFAEMDKKRAKEPPYFSDKRLFGENELPEIYKHDIKMHLEPAQEVSRRRERRHVVYDDGLTEHQWLQLQQEEDQSHKASRSKRGSSADAYSGSDSKKAKVELDPVEHDKLIDDCKALYDEVTNSVADEDDPPRARAGIFMELPSAEEYPDYYTVIKNPISLAEIWDKIENDQYTKLSEMKADLNLMLDNARKYNQEGSLVYEDATVLQYVVRDFVE